MTRSYSFSRASRQAHVTGPLQDPVTWYGINYAGTQVTQWDFQNKGKSGWTGTSSFVLEVPLRNLRPSIINSVPCDRIVYRWYLGLWSNRCLRETLFCVGNYAPVSTRQGWMQPHITAFTLILLTIVWTVRATHNAAGAIFQLEVQWSSIRDCHCSLDCHTSVQERITSDASDVLIVAFTYTWVSGNVCTVIAFQSQSCQFKQIKHQSCSLH